MKKRSALENYQPINPITILGFIFLTLKLTGHITWAWWLVLLPFIIVLSIVFLIAIFE